MSDTQKLTPALSTPGCDLLRREIYKGLADRAAGRVKDLDVDAILAKGRTQICGRFPCFGSQTEKPLVLGNVAFRT